MAGKSRQKLLAVQRLLERNDGLATEFESLMPELLKTRPPLATDGPIPPAWRWARSDAADWTASLRLLAMRLAAKLSNSGDSPSAVDDESRSAALTAAVPKRWADEGALRQDLQAAGLWPAFVERVAEHQKTQATMGAAWLAAAAEFAGRVAATSIPESGPAEAIPTARATPGDRLPAGVAGGDATPIADATSADHLAAGVTADDTPGDRRPPAQQPVPAGRYLDDAEWVYQNIADPRITRDDAPSPGAWWLLEQAKENPKLLVDAMILKSKRSIDEDEAAIQADCRKTEAELLATMERIKGTRLPGDDDSDFDDSDFSRVRAMWPALSASDRASLAAQAEAAAGDGPQR